MATRDHITLGATHNTRYDTNTSNITYLYCDSNERVLKTKLGHGQYKKFCVTMPTGNNRHHSQHQSIRSHKTYNTDVVMNNQVNASLCMALWGEPNEPTTQYNVYICRYM